MRAGVLAVLGGVLGGLAALGIERAADAGNGEVLLIIALGGVAIGALLGVLVGLFVSARSTETSPRVGATSRFFWWLGVAAPLTAVGTLFLGGVEPSDAILGTVVILVMIWFVAAVCGLTLAIRAYARRAHGVRLALAACGASAIAFIAVAVLVAATAISDETEASAHPWTPEEQARECRNRAAAPRTTRASLHLLFTSNCGGSSDVFGVAADGTRMKKVSREFAIFGWEFPAVEREGRRFAASRDSNSENFDLDVYVIRTNGSGARRLTQGATEDWEPSWSPDGRSIVFQAWRECGDGGSSCTSGAIELVGVTGPRAGIVHKVAIGTAAGTAHPSWSPDGHLIVFSKPEEAGGKHDLFTVRPDGTGLRHLTDSDDVSEQTPAWSPDGQRLAFGCGDDSFDVCVINADGTERRMVVETDGAARAAPAWSPDGKWIAYIHGHGDHREIWIVRPAGTDARPIVATSSSSYALDPTWVAASSARCCG